MRMRCHSMTAGVSRVRVRCLPHVEQRAAKNKIGPRTDPTGSNWQPQPTERAADSELPGRVCHAPWGQQPRNYSDHPHQVVFLQRACMVLQERLLINSGA